MILNILKRLKQEKERKLREQALGEVAALEREYGGKNDPTFRFETTQGKFTGAFVTASLSQSSKQANSYVIVLSVPSNMIVAGPCYIIDSRGNRLEAGCKALGGAKRNRVLLETTA
jgi:hypothetical protein